MNKSRIAAYCMCGALSASLLSGCSMDSLGGLMGKPPTVSNIVSSWAKRSSDLKSLDADLKLRADASMDMSSVFPTYNDGDKGSAQSAQLAVNLSADLNIQAADTDEGKVTHMTGPIDVTMGVKVSEDADVWSVDDGKEVTTYSHSAEGDEWIKSVSDSKSGEKSAVYDLSGIVKDNKFELKEDEKSKGLYHITGVVTTDDVSELMGQTSDELFSTAAGGVDIGDAKYNMTVDFQKEKGGAYILKGIDFDIDPDSVSTDQVSFDEFGVTITVNSLDDIDSLSVPKDVKENAVDEGDATTPDITDSLMDGANADGSDSSLSDETDTINPEDNSSGSIGKAKNLDSFSEFVLNKKTFKVGDITLKELLKKVPMKISDDNGMYIDSGSTQNVYFDETGDLFFSASVTNNGDSSTEIENAVVTGYYMSYSNGQSVSELTYKDALKSFGEPDSVSGEGTDYVSASWSSDSESLSISWENDVATTVSYFIY